MSLSNALGFFQRRANYDFGMIPNHKLSLITEVPVSDVDDEWDFAVIKENKTINPDKAKGSGIYFVLVWPYIKMGRTTNIERRLKQITIASPNARLIRFEPKESCVLSAAELKNKERYKSAWVTRECYHANKLLLMLGLEQFCE